MKFNPNDLPQHIRAINPHLFVLAPLSHPVRQPDKRSQSENRGVEKGKGGVGYSVAIISCRERLCDEHDNLRTGAKPLVDSITESLGLKDDADKRISWEYGQVKSGNEGTIVRITKTIFPAPVKDA
jgi:hypothetical protein